MSTANTPGSIAQLPHAEVDPYSIDGDTWAFDEEGRCYAFVTNFSEKRLEAYAEAAKSVPEACFGYTQTAWGMPDEETFEVHKVRGCFGLYVHFPDITAEDMRNLSKFWEALHESTV